MYPDNAYSEFYPAEIVEKVYRENPKASRKQLHTLMQNEWVKTNPLQAKSYGYLGDRLWVEWSDFVVQR